MRIDSQNLRGGYLYAMTLSTIGFVFFGHMIIGGAKGHPRDLLYISPLLALGFVAYVIALAVCVWGAFGVEEIAVDRNRLHWTRRALLWSRTRVIPVSEITAVQAVVPWHGFANSVEMIALGKRRIIGDKLLSDEATQLASNLRRAVGLLR